MGDQPHRSDQAGRDAVLSALRALDLPRRLGRPLARVGRTFRDAFFPQRCFGCGAIVDAAGALCPSCWHGFRFIAPPVCALCGQPFEYPVGDGAVCGACAKSPPQYDSARAALVYDDASRPLILAFKHGDRTRYAAAFGKWMMRAGAACLREGTIVVPVPLRRWRLLRRRYNQSVLLAWALARETGCRVAPDLLIRQRNTPPQGRLSRRARRRNVRSAFSVSEAGMRLVAGQSVVLVDDVYTTGATVEACARTLKSAGAKDVHVLTLARVVRPR
jgi:ComF family protein